MTTLPVRYPNPVRIEVPQIEKALIVGASVVPAVLRSDYPALPGIAEEVHAAQRAYPNSTVLTADDARAATIEKNLLTSNLLHFAGHAMATPAGLRFLVAPGSGPSGGAAIDGVWSPTSSQAAQLELAVLSACSTGRYEEVESLKPPYLAGELLAIGARQVVASLWNTDSRATSLFMQAFYQSLHRGGTVSAALQSGADEVRRQPGWQSPYYWAPFALFIRT